DRGQRDTRCRSSTHQAQSMAPYARDNRDRDSAILIGRDWRNKPPKARSPCQPKSKEDSRSRTGRGPNREKLLRNTNSPVAVSVGRRAADPPTAGNSKNKSRRIPPWPRTRIQTTVSSAARASWRGEQENKVPR